MQVGVSAVVSSDEDIEFVHECERVGAASVWVPEAWGYDALTPLAHLAAVTSTIRLATGIVQVGARSPGELWYVGLNPERPITRAPAGVQTSPGVRQQTRHNCSARRRRVASSTMTACSDSGSPTKCGGARIVCICCSC